MPTASVQIVEEGARDGLRNEQKIVSTADKLALIERLIATGAIEIALTDRVDLAASGPSP